MILAGEETHEAARIHHATRQHGGCMAARGVKRGALPVPDIRSRLSNPVMHCFQHVPLGVCKPRGMHSINAKFRFAQPQYFDRLLEIRLSVTQGE